MPEHAIIHKSLAKFTKNIIPKSFAIPSVRIADVGIAEDITSETFFKALKNLWKYKWQNISFSSWIYKIATNEINYLFRRGKYKHYSLENLMESGFEPALQCDLEAEIENFETQLQRHKDFLAIYRELKKLPVKYQEVIALRFFEDKKMNEIASILGKKEGTVKSLLSRGLDLLRDRWADSQQKSEMQPFSELVIIHSEGQANNSNPAREKDR